MDKLKHRPNKLTGKQLALKIVLSIVLWGGGILCIMPFLWMISTSFKGVNDVFAFGGTQRL